jgi:hypothetical protein
VTQDSAVELIQHYEAQAEWRSPLISLPLKDPVPVPRFPDRGHAVFLATGAQPQGGFALAGVAVYPEAKNFSPWSLPLRAAPVLTACISKHAGPMAVLLVSRNQGQSIASILGVDENGRLLRPEQPVRNTPDPVLAVAVDYERDTFVLLESDAARPDYLRLVRIRPNGATETKQMDAIGGWPTVMETVESRQPRDMARPARVAQAVLEITTAGQAVAGFIDERGIYFGGILDGSPLRQFAGAGSPKIVLPHIAAIKAGITLSGFTERGALAYFGR